MLAELEHLLYEVKSNQEKQILKTLIDNFNNVPNMTLEQIADLSYCSKTSVRRVLIKLGYKGFIDFQIHIKIENNLNSQFDKKEAELNSLDNFKDMVKFITRSKYIYIYGRGASDLAAQYLFRMLTEKAYTAIWINSQDLLYELEKENIIIISTFGQSDATQKILKDLVEKMDCNIATITSENSSLSKRVKVSLLYDSSKLISKNDQIGLFNIINELLKFL